MSYAVIAGTIAWRCVSTAADVQPGEVYAAAIYRGDDGRWDEATQTIIAPGAADLLARQKATVIGKINAERDRREQLNFPYAGKLIESDPVSVQRITVACTTAQMALAAGVPFALEWSCSNNTLLPLDAAGVLGMMQALGTHGLALHLHSRALKDAVNAAVNPDSVDITTGWPG